MYDCDSDNSSDSTQVQDSVNYEIPIDILNGAETDVTSQSENEHSDIELQEIPEILTQGQNVNEVDFDAIMQEGGRR